MVSKSGIPPIPHEEIGRLLESSAPTIHRHTALIHLENDSVFSGVYAKSFGYEGILTAGHCASDFLEAKHIALPVSEMMHRLWVEPNAFEHILIGYDKTEGYTSNGPDLSFVIIHDNALLNFLHNQQLEFYDLDFYSPKAKEVFFQPFAKFNWSVSGNPGEKVKVTKQTVDGQLHKFVDTTAALIQGNFADYELRDSYDYVKLFLGSGFEDFPASYKGLSGGGIWYQRFVTSDGKTYHVEPILAGVTVWQAEQISKLGYKVRAITGHGWTSIYGHVRKALAEK